MKDQRSGWLAELSEGDEVVVGFHAFANIRGRRRIARITPTGRIKTVSGYAFALARVCHDTIEPNGVERCPMNSAGPKYLYPADGDDVYKDLTDADAGRIITLAGTHRGQRALDLYRAVTGISNEDAKAAVEAMYGQRISLHPYP